jgi:hypothetical protein
MVRLLYRERHLLRRFINIFDIRQVRSDGDHTSQAKVTHKSPAEAGLNAMEYAFCDPLWEFSDDAVIFVLCETSDRRCTHVS